LIGPRAGGTAPFWGIDVGFGKCPVLTGEMGGGLNELQIR
jgi:hypothetical protein